MNRKVWGTIIIILALAVIAGIIYFFLFYKPIAPATEQAITPGPEAAVAPEPSGTVNQPAAPEPAPILNKAEVRADDLARLAAAFAERFGSFSNQSDYGNLRDLQIFMTEGLRAWSQNYINEARLEKADTAIYYGIVTKSIISQVKRFDADLGQAEILVKTQRRESVGTTGNSSAFYQDIIIKYLREGTVWRVDGAYWQGK